MCERKLLNRWNEAKAKERNITAYTVQHNSSEGNRFVQEHHSEPGRPHLFIQVYQGLVGQLQGLDGLQDCVPVAAVDVGHEALYAVHRVQGHRGLLLQGDQGPLQVVLLQVLHDQTDHAKRREKYHNKAQISTRSESGPAM